jgi:excisionase family DNA binding protein
MDVDEAAKLLGLSRNAAYAAVAAKQIPSLRLGRRIVIPRAALERMLEVAVPPVA